MNSAVAVARRFVLLAIFTATAAVPTVSLAQAPQSLDQSGRASELSAGGLFDPHNEWTHWTTGRYRMTSGDVLEVTFPFVPELNQTVTVQPDGYVTLKDVPDIQARGRTVEQVKAEILTAYEPFVREPVFTLVLKDYEKPYFVAGGEVEKPGRYELRGATTLTQALAFAGGPTQTANISKVVLIRRYPEGIEMKQIDVKRMFAKKDVSEDPVLRPGDMIVVPEGVLGKLAPLIDVLRWRIW